ncbi:MAG: nicotinate (nicotinamide) nucleotide adenylyltransferase [Thermodesulfobacteria bacterium]|nr:nicotinate (nicotinamide) nucleotide adenylyltransferase [Thermodesulfobacteriota bacterium]
MKRIGILGGTYDPIHHGHLRAAEEVREDLELEEVLFIPAGQPPHKHRPDLTPFAYRFEMTRLAVEGVPGFRVSDIEGRMPGPSYSVRTLERLRAEQPAEYFFVLGLDAFLEIETWFEYWRLPRLAHLVVISRGSDGERAFREKAREVFPEVVEEGGYLRLPGAYTLRFVPVTRLEISSTNIRRAVRRGRSIRFLVPESVRRFILTHGLYR